MNPLTLEQTNLLNEYILSYKLLNISNDFAVYDCLQNRLTNIIKKLGFQENTSQFTVLNFCQDTLQENN